ncbi:MAG: hypothetical protein GKR89_18415 [Candidatus Latescibacteria bacterium]|nr:hypothetical protein [Candidatus Latescibacterota bacterium]
MDMCNKTRQDLQKHQRTTRGPRLSDRLKLVYNLILCHQPLWDIGCDHGYLGLHAYSQQLCPEVHLVDRSRGALKNTRRRIAKWCPDEAGRRLSIWQRDAIRQTLPISRGTVVMAGLGSKTIIQMIMNLFPRQCQGGYG